MTKEILLKELSETKIENFLQSFRFQIDKALLLGDNEVLKSLKKEVANLITELNLLVDEVDNRQLSWDDYQKKLPSFNLKVKDVIEKLPVF